MDDTVLMPSSSFRILEERVRYYKNFGMISREATVEITPPRHNDNTYSWLSDIFVCLITHFINDSSVSPQDRVGITFYSDALTGNMPVGVSLREMDQFSIDDVLQMIERCVEKNYQCVIWGPLRVVFLHVAIPLKGQEKQPDNSVLEFAAVQRQESGDGGNKAVCTRRQGVIRITNDDKLCLARALVVGIAHSKKHDSVEDKRFYNYVRRHNPSRRQNRQTVEARRLCEQARVDLTKNCGGIQKLAAFQEFLKDFTIRVFTRIGGQETIFEGPSGTLTHPRKDINLVFSNEHYNVITKNLSKQY